MTKSSESFISLGKFNQHLLLPPTSTTISKTDTMGANSDKNNALDFSACFPLQKTVVKK